jgi:hypothetical protein
VGYYALNDHGEDFSSDQQFEDPERHWTHVLHRQALPNVGVLDVEYSQRSDPNFLNEYFKHVAQEEQEQESLFYFRRTFRDNIAVTGLYKYRSDDFETVTERKPEGKLFLLEQPVARTGIYSGLLLQGTELQTVTPDPQPDSPRLGRFDLQNQWAYPLGIDRYIRFRPFADVRYSEFSRGTDPAADSIDRESLGAGITASQEYSRVFSYPRGSIADRWFNFTQMKHEIIPQVTYRNLYYNSVEPDELLQFDEVDTVSTDERVELSLRNELLVRQPAPPPRPLAGSTRVPVSTPPEGRPLRESLRPLTSETRSLLDLEVSTDVFTHPARDNGGDQFSLLDVDLTFRPHQRFGLHSRNFFDPNEDLRFERTDTGITMIPVSEVLVVSVGERYTRDATTFTYTQCTLEMTPKYLVDFYYSYDFQEHRQADVEVRLTRIFHRFAMEVVWGIDFSENNNHSITVNVEPIELLGSRRQSRDHQFNH